MVEMTTVEITIAEMTTHKESEAGKVAIGIGSENVKNTEERVVVMTGVRERRNPVQCNLRSHQKSILRVVVHLYLMEIHLLLCLVENVVVFHHLPR